MTTRAFLFATVMLGAAARAIAGPSPVPLELDGTAGTVTAFPAQATAYDFSKLKREKLGRGLVAWRSATNVVTVSWRYLSSDARDIAFDVLRDGVRIATNVTAATQIDDAVPDGGVPHRYALVANGETLAETTSHTTLGYIEIPLPAPPDDGVTPDGQTYTYFPGDCSIGDVRPSKAACPAIRARRTTNA